MATMDRILAEKQKQPGARLAANNKQSPQFITIAHPFGCAVVLLYWISQEPTGFKPDVCDNRLA
ncbi:hypothetical protein BCM02_103255 [Paenibacillus methanolicus]|uniref:Uncharacterized protein n=1 Tax=Paenibacillus methanolicus TaxID=582686 RepID=A0A5S5CF17_9BACL|nr:hypothetical protein BCM02_103255 [Paenibacillus methanolicus]